MSYLNTLFVTAFIISSIRSAYAYYRFASYCKKHYPEIYSDFQSLGTISQMKVLSMEHPDIDDPEFTRLKNEGKSAYKMAAWIFFGGILIIILASILGLK